MGVLHSLYVLRINDSRYRHKLKQLIKKDFPERFLFISVGKKSPELVLDSSLPLKEVNFEDKTGCIIKAAKHLREEVIEYSNGHSAQFWITYMGLVKMQFPIHTLVQENNLRLFCWKHFLPFSFALNKVNCARYGTYYVSREYAPWSVRDVGKTRPECSSSGQVPTNNSCGSKRETDSKSWCQDS